MKNESLKLLALILSMILGIFALASCGQQGEPGINGTNGVDGKSAYELAVDKGYTGTVEEWLTSLVGEVGAAGQDGANGQSAYEIAVENGYTGTETEWLTSLVGASGTNGTNGANGKSAYELAVENGFEGSLFEWLDSLVGKDGVDGTSGTNGKDGKSAYELACDNGFEGSLTEWLASLVGASGKDGVNGSNGEDGTNGTNGKSAYELAVENGYEGTVTEWLASLVGEAGKDGINGTNGINGKSAYELAVELGYEGTEEQWIASLAGKDGSNGKDGVSGADGKSAYQLACENGFEGTLAQWLDSLVGKDGINGTNGADGKSAYELACDNGFEGSLTEWLASLIGETGTNGTDGKSAYELAVEKGYEGDLQTWLLTLVGADGKDGKSAYEIAVESGYEGTAEEWLKSLVGEKGDAGLSAFEIYQKYHPEYIGTEEEWIAAYVTGTLAQHTVRFDLNGGTASENFFEEVLVYCGEMVNLTLPEREGYTFIGWYTGDSVVDGCFKSTDRVTSDLSLKARWQVNEVTVTFVDMYGQTLSIQTLNYGEAATAPAIEAIIGNMRFDSWSAAFSHVTEDITIQARYIENKYTVSYDTNGLYELSDEAYYVGTIPTKPADPSVPGYAFGGWYLDPRCTQKYYFNYSLDAHTTLYARLYANMDGDYIVLSTAADLLAIANDPTAKYVLANDIDCQGNVLAPISTFSGELNGNGYSIHNFIISSSSDAGFIVTNSGLIQDLTLREFTFNVTHTGTNVYVGVLCAKNTGTISNCHVTATDVSVSASLSIGSNSDSYVRVGGLVGYNNGSITGSSCMATMDVYSYVYVSASKDVYRTTRVGGLVGENASNGTISASMYGGELALTAEANRESSYAWSENKSMLGGVVGGNYGTMEQSYSTATVHYTGADTNGSLYSYIGGFAGRNFSTICDSYSTAKLSASGTFDTLYIGGFVGINDSTIKNSYAMAEITTEASGAPSGIGGFVGMNESSNGYNGSISNSYSDSRITLNKAASAYGYFIGKTVSATEYHCYYSNTSTVTVAGETAEPTESATCTAVSSETLLSKEFLTSTLYFDEGLWNITDGCAPSLKCFN